MLQVALFTLLKKTIDEGLLFNGVTGYTVERGYQTVKVGAPLESGVFLYPLIDRRIGSPHQSSEYNSAGVVMRTTQKQMMESDFQIFARVNQGKNGETLSPTAGDIMHMVADYFMSDLVIEQLQAQNVGVLRITDVTNGYQVNDKDRHELVPTLEITLSHTITRVTDGNYLESITPGIYRV